MRSVRIEKISPKKAEKYLIHNNDNRPLRDSNITWLSDQMTEDDWDLVGDCVTFDSNGDLRNGQHRLHAIIKSGKTVEMIVFRGADPDSFRHMDCPSVRRAGDALAIMGYPYGRKAETAIRMITAMQGLESEEHTKISRLRWNKMTNTQIINFAEENEKALLDAIYYILDELEIGRLYGCNSSFFIGLYFVFASKNKTKAKEFFNIFADEDRPAKSSPIYKLQEKLVKLANSKTHTSSQFKAVMFVNAWNSFMTGDEVSFSINKNMEWPGLVTRAKGNAPAKKRRRSKAA
jgi:hypothetical protein